MSKKPVLALVSGMETQFKRALPTHFSPERFTRICLTAISKNPKLAECSQDSLLGSLLMFAQLGLEPNTPLGHAYLVPFKGEVTPIIGYKGYLDLAYRTGNFETIDVHAVYECDHFEYELGLDPMLIHKPGRPEKGKSKGDPIYFYAFYKLKNGGKRFRVWARDECLEHGRKHSVSFNGKSSPWQQHTDAMCRKTVLKDLLALAPMSPEDKQLWANAQQDNTVVKIEPKDIPEPELLEGNSTDVVDIDEAELI